MRVKIKDLYLEIVSELEKMADAERAKLDKYYHKTARHKSYGIKTAELEELIKKHRNTFKQLSLQEKLDLSRMFFESEYSEQSTFGIVILAQGVKEMKSSDFGFLNEIAGCLNNWGTTDGFSLYVMQPLLMAYPKETLNLLEKWNKSDNLWKRRASVVVFTRKVGMSGKFTDKALALCDNLIWDGEDMVRKGVGWALKDCMRGDKEKVLNYVKSLRQKGVSAVITLYAIRDLKGKERKEVLDIKP
ncbi:DNA alkylation repair protein [Candidatus Bathyarchaeota archaeon A05DMB-5]|nr:DNA alkylation repair protein [Candidatus Bathyarchaeota archaeon A05DMB-5]